ncbi:hypothetical protein [Thalassotalea hakodatensis]|uniref:hypothetical protein n=1 Tax=Thalassotalea hakodatensis TaxID=3030492 RepID=UPI0025731C0B|nr:hypothetical protein [Thalassotalea hakodatensis]
METNAQNTLVLIFQHVEIYFSLLDFYAHESKSATCFRISEYEAVLEHYARTKIEDKKERDRISNSLSLNNLNACSLLSFINEQRGIFAIQSGLLQTIQCLDSKRIRELGQPDLDIITAQIQTLFRFFQSPTCDLHSKNTETAEHLMSLMDIMQDTLAKIAHNVRALDGSSKRLSEILESHDFNKLVATEQVRSAIDEIIQISKRNIQPTLIFLNEKAMVKASSALYMIRKMRQQLENTPFIVQHRNISSIEMKLLSYSEVIRDIRQRLYRYVDMDRQQRELYNRIEERFNELHSAAVLTMDAKLKGKQLSSSSPLFADSRILWGLHNWSRSNLTSALFEFPKNDFKYALDEYIRTKLNRVDALGSNKRKPSAKRQTAKETLRERKRIRIMKDAMTNFEPSEAIEDVYLEIHELLVSSMTDYQLADIYDALPFIDERWKIRKTLKKSEIIYGNHKLSYMIKRLEATSHE